MTTHLHLTRHTKSNEIPSLVQPVFLTAEIDSTPRLPLLWAAIFDPEDIMCRLQSYGARMGDWGYKREIGISRLPTGLFRSSQTHALARLRERLPSILDRTDPFLHGVVRRFAEQLEAFEGPGIEVNFRILTSMGSIGGSSEEVCALLRKAWDEAMGVLAPDKPILQDTYSLYGYGDDRAHRLWDLEKAPLSSLWRHGGLMGTYGLLKERIAAHDLESLRDMYPPGMDPDKSPLSIMPTDPPLVLCARVGFWEGVDHLLGLGGDPTICGLEGRNVLHYAAFHNEEDRIRSFVNLGLPLDKKDSHQMSPLLFACHEGHLGAARVLVGLGADLHALDERNSSAVLFAVANNNQPLLELLLAAGAPANILNADHVDPLTLCVLQGFAEGQGILFRHLVSLDENPDAEAGHGNGCERD